MLPALRAAPLSLQQARALDVRAARKFKVPTRLLMENAGASCADVAFALWTRLSGKDVAGGSTRSRVKGGVVIFCGSGGNGGDGYVAARHLALAGVPVEVRSFGQPRPGSDSADARASWLAVRRLYAKRSVRPLLAIDAVLGTGVDRPVAGPALKAIRSINALRDLHCLVLAIDLPSGIDTDTGVAHGEAVRADVTLTIASRKRGLVRAASISYRGAVVVVPFGAPATPRR